MVPEVAFGFELPLQPRHLPAQGNNTHRHISSQYESAQPPRTRTAARVGRQQARGGISAKHVRQLERLTSQQTADAAGNNRQGIATADSRSPLQRLCAVSPVGARAAGLGQLAQRVLVRPLQRRVPGLQVCATQDTQTTTHRARVQHVK